MSWEDLDSRFELESRLWLQSRVNQDAATAVIVPVKGRHLTPSSPFWVTCDEAIARRIARHNYACVSLPLMDASDLDWVKISELVGAYEKNRANLDGASEQSTGCYQTLLIWHSKELLNQQVGWICHFAVILRLPHSRPEQ